MSDHTDLSGEGITRSRAGGVWSYRQLVGGKRIKVTTGTRDKAEAEKIAADKKSQEDATKQANARLGVEPMKFDRACDIWMTEQAPQMREKHLGEQVRWLKAKIGTKYLHLLRSGDLSAVRNARQATVRCVIRRVGDRLVPVALRAKDGKPRLVAPNTVNKTLRLMSRIINHAGNNHDAVVRHFKWSDFYLKTLKAKPRPISEEDEARIIEALREDYRALTVFATIAGLRASECLVRKDQVDAKRQMLVDVVSKTFPQGRDIPLSDDEMAIVRREMFRGDNDTDYVFTYEADATRRIGRTDRAVVEGKRYAITYNGWKAQWKLMKAATGLKKVRIHDLRHTAACRSLALTGNLKAVQEMLGHASPTTTAIYAAASEQMVRSAKQGTSAGARALAPKLAPKAVSIKVKPAAQG